MPISRVARWLVSSARTWMPSRSKAHHRRWSFSVNIGGPGTLPLCLLPRQTLQLTPDLLAREHGDRSGAIGIGAINQPGRLRELAS